MRTRVVVLAISMFVSLAMDARAQAPPVGELPGRVSGTVLSAEGAPVAAAAITLRSARDSSIVAGGTTAADGSFRLELPYGRYHVRVSHIGYAPANADVVTLSPAAPAAALGRITLSPAPIAMDAVTAAAERSAVVLEADRTVYDPKQLPQSAGTAIDVLRAVPELEVDVNGAVALRGNQAVAIHINGRPAPMQGEALTNFLSQLPGSRLAKVEVMPNPSAKQDPEGMGGIVNIVLRDNIDLGLSGNFGFSTSSRMQHGVNGRVNYQEGRLTLFSGVSINRGGMQMAGFDFRDNLLARPVTSLQQTFAQQNSNVGVGGDVTAEWKVGARATLWSSLFLNGSNNEMERAADYTLLGESDAIVERYDRASDGRGSFRNAALSFGFRQVFQPQRHELTMDVRRGGNAFGNRNDILGRTMMMRGEDVFMPDNLTRTAIDDDNGDLAAQADYTRAWGQGARINVGARVAQRTLDHANSTLTWADAAASPHAALRGGYSYDELFRSLYGTAQQSFGRFSAQLGLRAELAHTEFTVADGAAYDNDYNSLFPSVNLSYDLQQGRTIRLNYSKRIGRPQPMLLNPSLPQMDPMNRMRGNPELRPNYTHSFGGDVSWIGPLGTARLAPYYRHTVDNWEQMRTVDAAGVSTITWANIASVRSYGSTVTFSLRPTGRLNGSMSANVYREVRDAGNIDAAYSTTVTRWSAGGNFGYAPRPSLTVNGNVNYIPARDLVQGRMSAMFMSSIGLQQKVRGQRGTVTLLVNDPLDVHRQDFRTHDASHTQNSQTNMKVRQAIVRFSYNFGKPPQQQSRQQGEEEAAPASIIR